MADADSENRDVKDQHDEWSDEEKRKRYRAAFAALPPFTRKVFWAHRIDNLSYPEIANLYGIGIREVEREIASNLWHRSRTCGDGTPASQGLVAIAPAH